MSAHVSKTFIDKELKAWSAVELGDIYPVIYNDRVQQIGRMLMVHCPEDEDKVELLACPTPDDLPFDDRELAEFYELQYALIEIVTEADNYHKSFTDPEIFFARKVKNSTGIFDLLIRHVPES